MSGWPPTHRGPSSLGTKEGRQVRQDSEVPDSLFPTESPAAQYKSFLICTGRSTAWGKVVCCGQAVLDIYCQTGQNPVSAWIRTAGMWKRPVGAHGRVCEARIVCDHPSRLPESVSLHLPRSRACVCVCPSRGISGHQDWIRPGEPMPIPPALTFFNRRRN